MPYNSQGIETVESCKRIELSYLFKNGYIQKNKIINGVLSWNYSNGNKSGNINFKSSFIESDKYFQLYYGITNKSTNETKYFDYKIYFDSVKSNLGRGKIYYFLCPESEKRCKILYMAYGSNYFKSRQTYRNRIYYNIQRLSKSYYLHQRYFDLENKLNKIYFEKKFFKETYRGQETRAYKRVLKLQDIQENFDLKRLYSISQSLNSISKKYGKKYK